MAVIRLQLDVDSEVQPELHALLCAIGSDASREERLRQLAASGLVWERLRIEHQARRDDAGPDTSHAPAAGPSLLDPEAYETFLRELRHAVRELPVLTEVLDGDRAPAKAAVLPPPPPPPPPQRTRLQRMKEKGLFRNE
jgi:hypothetical protein